MSADDPVQGAHGASEDQQEPAAAAGERTGRPGRRPEGSGPRGRWGHPGLIALVVAASVVVAGLGWVVARHGGGQDVASGAGSATTIVGEVGGGPATGIETPSTSPSTSSVDTPTSVVRFRVDTDRVAADRSDPYLNVRTGPGPDQPMVAKLGSTYRGLRTTGTAPVVVADGGTWIEVEVLDPVGVTVLQPVASARLVGWVNRILVAPLDDGVSVGTGEVPACGSSGGGGNGTGGGSARDAYVSQLESRRLSPDCLRIVVSLGTGPSPAQWNNLKATGPAASLPAAATREEVGPPVASGLIVDLGAVGSAWPEATETADGVYLVRSERGSWQLVTPLAVASVSVTGLADQGRLVVDVRLAGGTPPPSGAGVVLTDVPAGRPGGIQVTGIARPFEATLDAAVTTTAGQPVEAVFSGSAVRGTQRGLGYGIETTAWVEAWGRFALLVEGLAPGEYRLVLNGQSGSDQPQTLSVPFTVDHAGPLPAVATADEQQPALGLIAFARTNSPGELPPTAGTVTLGLGTFPPGGRRSVPRAALADRKAWTFAPADGFAGYTGPFNALDQLAAGAVRITAGPLPRCASPAAVWPPELAGLRQLNVEPVGIDTCLNWYGVSLFLDPSGRIAAVVLDLFEP